MSKEKFFPEQQDQRILRTVVCPKSKVREVPDGINVSTERELVMEKTSRV